MSFGLCVVSRKNNSQASGDIDLLAIKNIFSVKNNQNRRQNVQMVAKYEAFLGSYASHIVL